MRAPLSDELLVGKMSQVIWILEKWKKELEERGIPGIHTPDSTGGQQTVDWLRQFCGELTMGAQTIESIVEIMASAVE